MKLAALLLFSIQPHVGSIHIRVLNPAHVPAATLTEAERMAGKILRAAGIEAIWVDCEAPDRPCQPLPSATDFWLHLLAHRPPILEPDTAGYALLVPDCPKGCGYAAISFPAIGSVAKQLDADPVHVLGATIAHEIGHLLLGARSHTRHGIMAQRFRREEISDAGRGSLFFDTQQAALLREAVQLRSGAGW
jgi:hypothetical protein